MTALAVLACAASGLPAAPLDTALSYQGRLMEAGEPVDGTYDLRFSICDADSGGSPVVGPVTNDLVQVNGGLFGVTVDFGTDVFTGDARWLEIGVRTQGGSEFSTLAPRQPLTPTPYALHSSSAGAASVAVMATSAGSVVANGVANASLQVDSVTSDKIAQGTIAAGDLNPALVSNTFWRLGGNAGTTPGTHFLGTTDNQAVEIKANNSRLLRLEPDPVSDAPNPIAGSGSNAVAAGVVGAVIAGGGRGTQFQWQLRAEQHSVGLWIHR